MKAVILVGGLGTRLRPLTCNTPKPMISLVNEPFIEYMIGTLRDQGITEVILAVQYLAERFRESLGDGSRLGVKLHIAEEPEARGTAGAVKNVEHMLGETTFILNGDVMTDLDLQAMLKFHRERNSKLTIALTPVEDPSAYGLVETNSDGHIKRFIEKPAPDEITTNMINAGTYIIEPELFRYVPPNEYYMFERGLFPVVLQTGDPMYAFPSRAYWTDIGKPQAYLQVHQDILVGKTNYAFRGEQIQDRVWVDGTADIDPTAQLIGPVVLGPDVRIGRNARIVGPTSIGARCEIGADVQIEGSVLWEDNVVGEGVLLRSSVVGRGNHIGAKSHIGDGSIISDYCNIGPENRLDRAIRVWPNTTLGERAITF